MILQDQSKFVLNKVNDYIKRRIEHIEKMCFFNDDYKEGYTEAMSEIHWFIQSAIEVNSEEEKIRMDNQKFIYECVRTVVAYANDHLDKSDGKEIGLDDVFVVWSYKALQNNKALLSTTLFDSMYYECTYNGDKNEMYFDAYKKWENIKIEFKEEEK